MGAPEGSGKAESEIEDGFIGFTCETCGATVTYDADVEGLRCTFCGAVRLARQPGVTGRIRAERYLPFEVGEEAATAELRRWLSRGFFRPFGLAEASRVVSMRPAYVPFWVFRGQTHTYYAGDTSRTPAFARADWCPVFGERSGEIDDILVSGSGSLRQGEVAAIAPFDFSRARPYRREDLKAFVVEDFGVSRRGARPRARKLIDEAERALCAEMIPGRSRNVHVNPLVTGLRSEAALLPVWIGAYRFKDATYRFLLNGQTGKATGTAPFSMARLALVIAVAVAVVAAALAAVAIFAR